MVGDSREKRSENKKDVTLKKNQNDSNTGNFKQKKIIK